MKFYTIAIIPKSSIFFASCTDKDAISNSPLTTVSRTQSSQKGDSINTKREFSLFINFI